MTQTRIKISSVIENQLPEFVREEFPLVSEFLSQYYTALETNGSVNDILQNIDQYVKVDNLTNLIDSTNLSSDVTFFDSTINVESTAGFPDSYGLLLIDSEIITYTSKTSKTFEGCVRGFSGVTSYKTKDELTFSETESQQHFSLDLNGVPTKVSNLSVLFLKEFLLKVKKQITPGFEYRELYSDLNENVFIKQAIDFYSSKGTDNSFKILFGALYGENVEVIRPRDYLIQPSDAQYRITSDLVVEKLEGNPSDLVNRTLYQEKSEFINQAQGTVTNVEEIRRGNENYYVISLDSDYDKDIVPIGTVYGKFSIHPQTTLLSSAQIGSETLEVDSTVSFPVKNGSLVVHLENGTSLDIKYESKTLNQFLGCSGITQEIPELTQVKSNLFASSKDKDIKIRILGVLSDLEIPDKTTFYSKGDTIKIKNLGKLLSDVRSNNWFFNIPVTYNVKSINSKVTFTNDNSNSLSYEIETFDEHVFRIGDIATLVSSVGELYSGKVISFTNKTSFSVQFGNDAILSDTLKYTVKKELLKTNTSNYSKSNKYLSNVQNVYFDDVDNSLYVASSSLPSYNNLSDGLKINDRSITFSGTFTPDDENDLKKGTTIDFQQKHGFYTGDSIVYKPSENDTLGLQTGVYFIKTISETKVKIARSKDNIFTDNFVALDGTAVNSKFENAEFTFRNLDTQTLESQKLLRKISDSQYDGKIYQTPHSKPIGIFVNGVELLNYKSKDDVFYGPIKRIFTTAPGDGYDVINPPILNIVDPIGTGATAKCSVVGSLERIDIIDPGFDYLEEPVITISGGNGNSASARANLSLYDHEVFFNSQSKAELVTLNPTNTISFSEYHKFRNFEEVIYQTSGQQSVSGLTTNSSYFVSIQDQYTVKLHPSFDDAVNGTNTIQLTAYGVGNHSFKSKIKKTKISSITVENPGIGYQNKFTSTGVVGINTATDTVTIKNHGYSSGEIVVYNATQTPIGGLSSSTSYYVTKVDDDKFKLSQIGIGTSGIVQSFYYDTLQYIDFTSKGEGVHKFNYPEIKVSVTGKIGISTLSGQNFNAVIQPVFRGKIQSVFLESGGNNYGSEQILNHNRQPLFDLYSGSGIQLQPIVSSDGRIVDVIINSPGDGYNSPPNIEVVGSGSGAVLTPVFSNGALSDVKIIHGGLGYKQEDTSILVNVSGKGAKFESEITPWKINIVERLLSSSRQDIIGDDDGILYSGANSNYGLQYTHAYSPRELRKIVLGVKTLNGKPFYSKDLQIDENNNEIISDSHSPIIGWAYDGNPIYGPYGFSTKTGGNIIPLKSGYSKKTSRENGPDTSLYPLGIFVEDYEFTGNGDLDEHNGRFCVTPEYPNGVYAYFTCIDVNEDFGINVKNYKKPTFPYAIGDTFKSKPISYNFEFSSNQDFVDINEIGWKRNTTPYNLLSENSSYGYIFNSNDIKPQNSEVKSTSIGGVDSIGIVTGGSNYKIGDRVFFTEGIGENNAKFVVSQLQGKSVSSISVATSSFDNVEFYPYENTFLGFTTVPHNYIGNDLITFTGKYDYKKTGKIDVDTNELVLFSDIGSTASTGTVTYFNVFGNLGYPNVKENDIYSIEGEEVKILNIDIKSSRIRVLRNQNGTVGLAHSSGVILTEKPKKFKLNFGISTSYNFDFNREIYFNPSESVGLGTTSGVGINSIFFVNLNDFNSQVSIGTGTTTFLFFNKISDINNYKSGGYIDIVNSTDVSFNTTKKKIIGIGETSIKIDFDSSSLSGVGVVAYANKWNILEIPTKTIYVKDHNLNTGDSLTYSSNGGTPLGVSTNGTSTFSLQENSTVYVAKISNDLIGISTIKVGIGSIGTFVGVGSTPSGTLYFNSIGSGVIHSFKTNYQNTLRGQVSKNVVTVSTAQTHGLSLKDEITIDVNSGLSTSVDIQYDDYNRRLVANPRSFSTINIEQNIINIKNHNYVTGQKVLYTANTPAGGLQNNKMYYLITIDNDRVKLAENYYKATKVIPEEINITSSTSGTISAINPPIRVNGYQSLVFNLSNSSLSYVGGVGGISTHSAFDFKLFEDATFNKEFESSKSSQIFEVTQEGRIGIDSTAKVILKYLDKTPNVLYYNLVPKYSAPSIKKEIARDLEVVSANNIILLESKYNGKHEVVGISSTSFEYNLADYPEEHQYTNNVEYYTNSKTAQGPIHDVLLKNSGRYSVLPGITSISSTNGDGAILLPETKTIGEVKTTSLYDIGFKYSSDYSIRPTTTFLNILKIKSLYSFNTIDLISRGVNYNYSPNLIVIDSVTNNLIEDVELKLSLNESKVTILKNPTNLSEIPPKILPINNSNGFKISNISFNSSSKEVTVSLEKSFSDPEDFPFEIGSKVLIEGVSVGVTTTAKGYNSSNYNYALFTLKSVDPQLGGGGPGSLTPANVVYDLTTYLGSDEVPGSFNEFYSSSARIIPESYFPTFKSTLKKNIFYKGENILTSQKVGVLESWNSINDYMKISTLDNFVVGDQVIGESSASTAIVEDVVKFESEYKIDSTSKNRKGWKKETGFLNNQFQRVHDSDYYQYFSYSLKSKKDFETWNDPVSALNHTAGFKKFSDLQVENITNIGINTDQNGGDFVGIADFSNVVDTNCVFDFDLCSENNLYVDKLIQSDEIIFNSEIIQDYIESEGNKVLMIDDFSDNFNSNPRVTKFSVVDRFDLSKTRSKKYLTFVQDRRFFDKRELGLLTLLHNGTNGFINQYGFINVSDYIGSFDFNITGNVGNLLFYPIKTKYNDYTVELFSLTLNDIVSGIGNVNLGNSVEVGTATTTIPSGTSSSFEIVGISTSLRSSKLLVQIDSDSYYEIDELTYVHDGTNVYFVDYGQVTTNTLLTKSSSGIGYYDAQISNNQVIISLTPYEETTSDYVVNTFKVSLSDASKSGIGSTELGGSLVKSTSTQIASSGSPTANIISSFPNSKYDATYLVVSIEDKTNSNYQVSEFISASYEEQTYTTEFGLVQTNGNLGIITSGVDGNNTKIYFTPNPSIESDVKVFAVDLGLKEENKEISLTNGSLNYDYGIYKGTHNDIKKDFYLTHNNTPIFHKYFDGGDTSIVKIDENKVRLKDHFYVTGEKISYVSFEGPIGIATTYISGIGNTDKLPPTLYVVKLNDQDIRFASSSENALKTVPEVLTLTSVGTGSNKFESQNEINKCLISIDNVIQQPIVSTSTTSLLSQNISFFAYEIYVNNPKNFLTGDLVKIDDEIMKIASVGIGSTNKLSVIRPWLGTGISTHSSSTLVRKIDADYNIVDNRIYFESAPYGKIPLSDDRYPYETDWVGITTSSSFSGRVFLRSGVKDTTNEPYSTNYIVDDISEQFNGIGTIFTLKSNQSNITGISTDNGILLINSILQEPNSVSFVGSYNFSENSGITSITFVGNTVSEDSDVNTASIPRGGIILSTGSSTGFGYQPLVSAGGTAVVSAAGTIQSISIGNSGSGYRSGIQTSINVGVKTENSSIHYVGIASVIGGNVVSVAITNPGIGYTNTNPPTVIFDSPLSYANLPLVYSSQSQAGVGTGAKVDIVVGQGSSVISFEMKNLGYGYKRGDILTISTGGTLGINTTGSSSFSEFQIIVDEVFNDKISCWTIGRLIVIDHLDNLFDGKRRIFPFSIDGNRVSLEAKKGSNLDLQATLLVFINDVLQVPGKGYTFKRGSRITFSEAPKPGDKSKILFYSGTINVDTKDADILETIKVGDDVKLSSENENLIQDERFVIDIISSDSLQTNLYPGPGVSENISLLRPLKWCRQTDDLFINDKPIGKDRVIYEPYVQPSTNIIETVGIETSTIYVESVKTFFDSREEYVFDGSEKPQNKIILVTQKSLVSASATSTVSSDGIITSINLLDGGSGYTSIPSISVSNPKLIKAEAYAVLSESLGVDNIVITNPGYGYTVAPNVSFSTPEVPLGATATASVTLANYSDAEAISTVNIAIRAEAIASVSDEGTINNIQIVEYGNGYTNAPTITISSSETGDTATAVANIDENGQISTITITYEGSGYIDTPDVTFSDPDISIGIVNNLIIRNTGYGYTSAPTIAISSPVDEFGIYDLGTLPGDATATAVATIDENGQISNVTITNNGYGYTSAPIVTISPVGLNGTIESISVTNIGYGYTVAPTVTISSPIDEFGIYNLSSLPGDATATAIAIINGNGEIDDVIITNRGYGYQQEPSITLSSPSIGSSAVGIASIGVGGTITSITITNPGSNYLNSPILTIDDPKLVSPKFNCVVDFEANITESQLKTIGRFGYSTINPTISKNGSVTEITVENGGYGFDPQNPPIVLIEPPALEYEIIDNVTYSGDFGIIVGYGISTMTKSGMPTLDYNIFDLHIPTDSYLRNSEIVGTAVTLSQIQVNDFFVVKNSNVGFASTGFYTWRNDGTIIGLSTQNADGIYQVNSIETVYKNVPGVGNTHVVRVTSIVESTSGLSTVGFGTTSIFFDSTLYTFDYIGITTFVGGFISTSNYHGEFSWGKITNLKRTNPQIFDSNGFSGITSSASVSRFNRLKYKNYN